MPTYKLTYFNFKGRGEAARLLFVFAGQKFEDNRIEMKDWPALKSKTPLGFLPILEVDGQEISQCMAINRLIAREFNIYGNTIIDQARGDMLADVCLEIMNTLQPKLFIKDEKEKKESIQKYFEETFSNQVGSLEKYAPESSGFFLGDNISWIDIVAYQTCQWFTMVGREVTSDQFPKLRKLMDKVEKNERIAEWIKNRPVTDL